MSLASSASGNRSRRNSSRGYDGSGSPLTRLSRRNSSLKPRRLQSAYFDDKQGVSKCRSCGWIYPHANPPAKERREHKKHCHETLKVQRWLVFADFRDDRKRLPGTGNERVDDDQKPVSNQAKPSVTASQNIGGPERAGAVDRERGKTPLTLEGNDQNSDGRRTESGPEQAPSAPIGVAAEGETNEKGKEARDSESSVQGNDLARTRGPQEGGETGNILLHGVPQIPSSHLDTFGVESSELVTASEDAAVHDLERIDNVNKLQQEKQAGSGSLQDTSGTSNEKNNSWEGKHGTDDRNERIDRDDKSNYNDVLDEKKDDGQLGMCQSEPSNSTGETGIEPTQPETPAGTMNKKKEIGNFTLASKNWQDWEDIVREENKSGHGIGDEAGHVSHSEREKKAYSDQDPEKTENVVTDPVAIPGPKHGSDKSGRKPVKQSLAERNWDDWDDVIFQSAKLLSFKDTTKGAVTLSQDPTTFESREESHAELESGQRNERSKQVAPDLGPGRPGDDSTVMLEGKEKIPVAYEVPIGVDGHLSEPVALWKKRDHKGLFTFRALSSNDADDVGLLSSRSRSSRRIKSSFEKVNCEWPAPSNDPKAQARTTSTIPTFARGCFSFRPTGNSSLGRSMSDAANGDNTLVLVPTPDIILWHCRPAASTQRGKITNEEPSVSRRRKLSQGDITQKQPLVQRSSSAPLAICEHTALGLRSWKSNFLRLLRNQTKYNVRCPSCKSCITNKMKMGKKERRHIYKRDARVTDALEIRTNISDISPFSGNISAVGVDYDDLESMSGSSSNEMEDLKWNSSIRGCIDHFFCP